MNTGVVRNMYVLSGVMRCPMVKSVSAVVDIPVMLRRTSVVAVSYRTIFVSGSAGRK